MSYVMCSPFKPQVRELNERCQKLGLEAVYATVQHHDDEQDDQQVVQDGSSEGIAQGSTGVPTAGMQTNDHFEEVRCSSMWQPLAATAECLGTCSLCFDSLTTAARRMQKVAVIMRRSCGGNAAWCTARRSWRRVAAARHATSSSPSRCGCTDTRNICQALHAPLT
jgi:hypothetical protein